VIDETSVFNLKQIIEETELWMTYPHFQDHTVMMITLKT
jgi:hypothetical protein